jgi:hypothetical protein
LVVALALFLAEEGVAAALFGFFGVGVLGVSKFSEGSEEADLFFEGVVSGVGEVAIDARRGLLATIWSAASVGTVEASCKLALEGTEVRTPTEDWADGALVAVVALAGAAPAVGLAARVERVERAAGGSSFSWAAKRAFFLSGWVGVKLNSTSDSSASTVRFRFTTDFVSPCTRFSSPFFASLAALVDLVNRGPGVSVCS